MKNDFIKDLDYLGFASRLKRLSDNLLREGKQLYQELNIEMESNWYLIFKLIESEGSMGVTEIAEHLQFSHPSVIAITNKMEQAGYIISSRSERDSRKRLLTLSPQAKKRLPEFEIIWEAATQGISEALDGLNGLDFIDQLEKRLYQKGFKDRAITALSKHKMSNNN